MFTNQEAVDFPAPLENKKAHHHNFLGNDLFQVPRHPESNAENMSLNITSLRTEKNTDQEPQRDLLTGGGTTMRLS